MVDHFSKPLARAWLMPAGALVLLGACSQGLDYDLRGLGGGASTTEAARQVATADRPSPDARGVISYPNYQVAVANNGDTIQLVAQRLGLDAPTLARFNGIEETAPLRSGEIIALPSRVPETAPAGATTPGSVDIGALAGNAIERSENTSSGDVRVAALPPSSGTSAPAAAPVAQEPVRHKVVRGETAYTISRLYGVPVTSLAEWNGLGSDFAIREGQYLLIPVAQRPAPAAAEQSAVTLPGSGSPTPTPPSATQPLPENLEAPPVAETPAPKIDVGERSVSSDNARMLFPVTGTIIREYGGRSDGIDIKAEPGTAVKAADNGTVAAVTKSAEGIPIIVVRHEPELLTVYANVVDVSVEKGATVSRGQSIAKLRDGKESFVHFEVRRGFDSVDPMPYLR